jgi:coenzyme Q-binding protein COQ10
MQYMSNRWIFRPAGLATEIDFHVEFAFRSKMLEKLMGLLFHEAVTRMVRAFEIRATKVLTRSA